MRSVGRLSLVQALTDHGRTPTVCLVCLPELYTQNSDIVSILNPLIAIHTVILTMAVVFHKTGSGTIPEVPGDRASAANQAHRLFGNLSH